MLLGMVGALAMVIAPSATADASQLTPFAYVTNNQEGTVSAINTSTNTVVATVPVGISPLGVAITPNGAFAYVANDGGNSISTISTSTNTSGPTVYPLGGHPTGVAITPNGAFAYVANGSFSETVSVISTSTNAVVDTVTVGNAPEGVAITPNGAFAYVANGANETVSVISTSTNAVVATVAVGVEPRWVAITPNGAFAYVANTGNHTVSVISTSTNAVVDTVTGLPGAASVAITPNGAFAYVANAQGVSVISTSTNAVVAAVPAEGGSGVAITPNGALAYATNHGSGTVSVIDTSTNAVVATVDAGAGAAEVAITPPIAGPIIPTATPPVVRILSGPPKESANQKAVFTFEGVAGGTYECSIDDGAWEACTSGDTFGPLLPGDHLFQVRETLAGLTGPAASYRWTIALPKACVLRVARARVFSYTKKHKVRLVIHYTSYRPAKVTVSYKLVGTKGRATLGRTSASFKKAGVFRDPENLSSKEIGKVRAARLFKVHFKIPNTPHSCGRYYTKQLTIPREISGQTVWFQSDSNFAP